MRISIPKLSIKHYYLTENHTIGECAAHFQCCTGTIERRIKQFRLVKTAAQKEELKVNSHIRRAITQRKFIPKNEMIHYHLFENHSVNESARHFGVSRRTFQRRLREFNIKKPSPQQISCRLRPLNSYEPPASPSPLSLPPSFSFTIPVQDVVRHYGQKADVSLKHSFSLTVKKPTKS